MGALFQIRTISHDDHLQHHSYIHELGKNTVDSMTTSYGPSGSIYTWKGCYRLRYLLI